MILKHWTEESLDAFLFNIGHDFISQLEEQMQIKDLNHEKLANILKISTITLSEYFDDPRKISLKTMLQCSRAVGMKLSVLAYDDGDESNKHGPINSKIFLKCWEDADKPRDMWAFEKEEE